MVWTSMTADAFYAISGPPGQAMLVTPFALVTPQIGRDCCGPLMTVVVPWDILQGRRHAQLRAGAIRVTTGQDPDPPVYLAGPSA